MSTFYARLWLLCLYLLHAAFHQTGFQAVYLDSDQLVIADQAAWMARGELHEPFFFGQAYLLPFEAYLAAPLVWLGLLPIAAVKAVAALCLYLPFAWTTWVLAAERPRAALAVTALFLGLNPEYMLTASMPRGFIGATALAWLGLWLLLRREGLSISLTLAWAVLVGFCAGSYMSIALMLPALVWLPRGRQWLLVGLGLLLGFLLFKGVGQFYKWHPDHVVHLFPRVQFRIGYLIHNWGVHEIAKAVTHLSALTLGLCALALFPGSRPWNARAALPWLLCLLGLLVAVLMMVANNKIVEFNSKSPFFSVYRMMLPLPFLGLLLLGRKAAHAGPDRAPAMTHVAPSTGTGRTVWTRHGAAWLFALSLLGGLQVHRLLRVAPHFAEVASTVPPITFDWLRENCEEIGGWWRASGEPYFVLEGRNDALAYGCHAQHGVPVVQTVYERRTWLRARLDAGVPR